MSHLPNAPRLLLVTSGMHLYREYLLASIGPRYPVHLISDREPDWEAPYLAGHTLVPDTGIASVLAAARRIAGRHAVAGVLTWHEEHIEQCAAVAEELHLPGSGVAAVRRCRDKFATRQALRAAGLPQPDFRLVGSAEQALAAAAELGYPVVLKPRAAGGSQGVVRVESPDELLDHFTWTRDVPLYHVPDFADVVLVEECLTGPEVSVDAAVTGGRVVPVFVGRKEVGFPPWFEETGHLVAGDDPLLADDAFRATLTGVHEALGYTDGWTHSEWLLTDSGPRLIEVNGRLGGDLIPYLGMQARGIDPGLVVAALACGEDLPLQPDRADVAGVRFFYPPADDTVVLSVGFDPAALPAGVGRAAGLVESGAVVSPPRKGMIDSRIAMATAVAPTVGECRAALDAAGSALRLEVG